jgi:hypothetical protein
MLVIQPSRLDQNSAIMLPSKHQVQSKCSVPLSCCTFPTVHFPFTLPYSLPNALPCFQPTFTRRTSGHCLLTCRIETFADSPPPPYNKCTVSRYISLSPQPVSMPPVQHLRVTPLLPEHSSAAKPLPPHPHLEILENIIKEICNVEEVGGSSQFRWKVGNIRWSRHAMLPTLSGRSLPIYVDNSKWLAVIPSSNEPSTRWPRAPGGTFNSRPCSLAGVPEIATEVQHTSFLNSQ